MAVLTDPVQQPRASVRTITPLTTTTGEPFVYARRNTNIACHHSKLELTHHVRLESALAFGRPAAPYLPNLTSY